MSSEISPFDGPPDSEGSFEALGEDNGTHFWWLSVLREALGYDNASIRKPVNRAIAACAALNISVPEHFNYVRRETDDGVEDCKLSRFACYLIAMNCNPTHRQLVAKAQVFFAGMLEFARQALEDVDSVERVLGRDELTQAEKSLSSTAKSSGVHNFAIFRNKGYLGLYNLSLQQILTRKGLPRDVTLHDYMGKEELAANWYRITQTEAKIVRERIKGQYRLEDTAYSVGREVRESIERLGGTMPENLPAAENIATVRTKLKKTAKEFQKMDNPKRLPPGTADCR